jgi:hypothetical protein
MVSQVRGDEPRLALGDSGDGVRELQFRLYRLGWYRQFPDGTYDLLTENAVRELQSSYGQDNTGEVTADTWAAIVYWEQQYGLDYQYMSPSDALDQLRYDLDHAAADQDAYQSADQAEAAAEIAEPEPQFSADGYWRWDGSDWVATTAEDHIGRLSPDGYWRWDGYDWVVV